MSVGARAALIILLLASCFGAGWTANGWRLHAQMAEAEAGHANQAAADARAAVSDLVMATDVIRKTAEDAQERQKSFTSFYLAHQKDLQNANPLPPDCKPDDFRVRHLRETIDQGNKAIAGQ